MIKVKTSDIKQSLSILSQVASDDSNVKIDAINDKIKLTASNNKIQIDTSCDASIVGNESFCINYGKLSRYVNSCNVDFIEVSLSNNKALLKSKTQATVNILPSSSFAGMNVGMNGAVELKINSKLFDSVKYAVAKNDSRQFLNGISVSVSNNLINVIASDSFRSASLSEPIYTDSVIECIIQAELASILSKTFDDEVDLIINKNSFSVTNGATIVIGKNIDFKYPVSSFKSVFDIERPNHALVDSKILTDAVNSVIFIDKDVILTFCDNKIEILSKNKQGESSDVEIGCEYSGEKITIGLISNYLIDALKNIDGYVNINMADSKSLVVTGINDNTVHLIAGKII